MKPRMIGIMGPSGSGKSTVTKSIESESRNVLRINLDNYFKDVEKFPKVDGLPNWDLPENINFDLLFDNLKDLKEGQDTRIPIFNKALRERSYEIIRPSDVILVEGFLLFCDERIRSLLDKKIFIDISDRTQFERRAKREVPARMKYIERVVIPNFKTYGLPCKKYADLVIDGEKDSMQLKQELVEAIFTKI